MMALLPSGTMTVKLLSGRIGYVGRNGMTYIPGMGGDCSIRGGWAAARPVQFDDTITDVRTRQEWATVRIHDLTKCDRVVAACEWTRAAGRTPALLLAERVGPRASAALLHAFGLYDAKRVCHAVEWALAAHPRDFAGAQDSVRRIGVMYVLAALELLDFRALYTFVVAIYKVPHYSGLALR